MLLIISKHYQLVAVSRQLCDRTLSMIEVLTVKYLNNIVEQSHRMVKGKMHQCLGWKSWAGAKSTLTGVELCSMIKKGQMINSENVSPWEQFYSLAA